MNGINKVYEKDAMHLQEIYSILEKNKITLSKTEAAKIVGGVRRLEKLAYGGKIRFSLKSEFKKARWMCSASDVYKNAKELFQKNETHKNRNN